MEHFTQRLVLEENSKMEPNLPNGSNEVICINSEVKIKDAYNVKAATVLGVVHIICGVVALGADIGQQVEKWAFHGLGIGTSVIFFVSGGLAIGGAQSLYTKHLNGKD